MCGLGAERVKALKTLVFVESTWEDAGSVLRDPALRGLKHVRLDLDAPDVDTVDCEDVTIPSDPSVHSVHSDLPPSDMSASLAERKTKKAKKAKKAKKVGLYWRKTPVAVPGSSGGGKRSQGSKRSKVGGYAAGVQVGVQGDQHGGRVKTGEEEAEEKEGGGEGGAAAPMLSTIEAIRLALIDVVKAKNRTVRWSSARFSARCSEDSNKGDVSGAGGDGDAGGGCDVSGTDRMGDNKIDEASEGGEGGKGGEDGEGGEGGASLLAFDGLLFYLKLEALRRAKGIQTRARQTARNGGRGR